MDRPQAPNNPYRQHNFFSDGMLDEIDGLRNQAPGLTIRDVSFMLASHHAAGRLRGREEGREPLPGAYDDGYAAGYANGEAAARDGLTEHFVRRALLFQRLEAVIELVDEARKVPRKREAEPKLARAADLTRLVLGAVREAL